jgi:hypothetical protein
MNEAWLMAGAVGVCNGGVALAGKAAERSRCRAMPFCLASVLLCALVFRETLTTRKLVALAAGLGAMALTPWR